MKIERMKRLQNGKYKLILDGKDRLVTYDDVILEHNLLFHREIDGELWNQLRIDTKYYDLYHKVIHFIEVRVRSEKEIRDYLEKKEVLAEDQERMIAELKRVGLIDDTFFAKAYLYDKLHLTNYGPNRLKADLAQHQIDMAIVEDEILKIEEDFLQDKIAKLIDKKRKTNKKHSIYYLKQKILGEMMALGYDREQVIAVMDQLTWNHDDSLKREYQKQYQKLSKKYDGEQLFFYLKQKLLQKGYTSEEIDICSREDD